MTEVEEPLRERLLEYRRENWSGIQTPEWQERIVDGLVRADAADVLDAVGVYRPLAPGDRILDVGCGVGSFVVGCARRGYRVLGIEPDRIGRGGRRTSIGIAACRLPGAFVAAVGEALPFPAAAFDLVVLRHVLEHVRDQGLVVREAARVLKPGGALYLACPNYLRFWEPHYKVAWLPLLPKVAGRAYLRLRGRDPVMLGQLTYTTSRTVAATLRGLGPGHEVIDLNRERFAAKCRGDGTFASRRGRLARRLAGTPAVGAWLVAGMLAAWRTGSPGLEFLVLKSGRSAL